MRPANSSVPRSQVANGCHSQRHRGNRKGAIAHPPGENEDAAQRATRTNLITVLLGSFATVGLLGLVYFLTRLDMQERRRVEAMLRETEEFKTRILESSDDWITILSLEGQMLSMNAEGQRSMGIEDF